MDKENSIPCGLTIRCFEFNMIGENCYVVSDETRDCVIMTPTAFRRNSQRRMNMYTNRFSIRRKSIST